MAGQTVLIELAQGDRVQVDNLYNPDLFINPFTIQGISLHLHWTARQAWEPSDTVPGSPSQTSH